MAAAAGVWLRLRRVHLLDESLLAIAVEVAGPVDDGGFRGRGDPERLAQSLKAGLSHLRQ